MSIFSVKLAKNTNQIYKKILLIKLSSLGDVCHTLPSLTALRNLYPTAHISWIVNKPFADIVRGHPLLDEVIVIDQKAMTSGNLSARYKYYQKLKQELRVRQFDLVLDMQGLFKSSVIALMTGCETRYGYWEMREGSGLVSKGIKGIHAQDHVIQRYLDVIRFLGSDVAEPEFVLPDISAERAQMRERLQGMNSYVAIAPGARWASKEWPLDSYVDLAIRLIQDGYQPVLLGGVADADKSRYIIGQIRKKYPAGWDKVADLTGQTSLKQLMAVCKDAVLYISGDTGPLHVAVTTGVPIIAMYGPTIPHRTGPYVSKKQAGKTIILTGRAECRPCRQRECATMECMKSIGVEDVYNESVKQLGSR